MLCLKNSVCSFVLRADHKRVSLHVEFKKDSGRQAPSVIITQCIHVFILKNKIIGNK